MIGVQVAAVCIQTQRSSEQKKRNPCNRHAVAECLVASTRQDVLVRFSTLWKHLKHTACVAQKFKDTRAQKLRAT